MKRRKTAAIDGLRVAAALLLAFAGGASVAAAQTPEAASAASPVPMARKSITTGMLTNPLSASARPPSRPDFVVSSRCTMSWSVECVARVRKNPPRTAEMNAFGVARR